MDVPFVDVVTTMLDRSLSLTVREWEEWGNPAANQSFYYYMKSYSPYDNIRSQEYTNLFVTGGTSTILSLDSWLCPDFIVFLLVVVLCLSALLPDLVLYLKVFISALLCWFGIHFCR